MVRASVLAMQGMLTMVDAMRVEKRWPARTRVSEGQKVGHLREVYGLTLTAYYQRLAAWLDDPDFIAIDPVHARVLRERRDGARHRRRAA